jgi:hypothetical protein
LRVSQVSRNTPYRAPNSSEFSPISESEEIDILCVKSILAGSNCENSLNHGNGIVAIHNPRIAARSARVQSGNRKMYERMRAGLNCGSDGMAERGGCKTVETRQCAESRDGRLPMTGSQGSWTAATRLAQILPPHLPSRMQEELGILEIAYTSCPLLLLSSRVQSRRLQYGASM